MNRLRMLLVLTALITGGSALASAQDHDQNWNNRNNYRVNDRDDRRSYDRDDRFKSYDRDDRYRSYDRDVRFRDRDDRWRWNSQDRDRHDDHDRR